jgi:5-oxoprolinase (ATP-hydrolysing)
VAEVRHGTTVATNALLERRGARVCLVTTAGFEDVLRLRRQARPDLYALHPEVPPPLVDPADCVGVAGRLGPDGEEVEPLEPLDAWIERHRAVFERAEAIAVCLLHAHAHDRHEAPVVAALAAAFPGRPVAAGHRLAPVFREYERASTVAVNAHVAPVMSRYVARLADALRPARLTVMASAGGLMSAERAAREPVHTLLSGPAGGVRGAWAAGRRCGRDALLAFDMGGTSTDVSVVRGDLVPEDEGLLAEHPLRVPLLPIDTVGAGGGSIAFVDAGGALRVGPRSAGAVPGPACYGRAGADAEPTVTDAHVVLGRLPSLLGGEMALDAEAARQAVGRLAARLGTPLEETARAILAVAEATMARACKRVSMERGIDPRTLTLVAFGGAGGLHACALADALGCREVLFPREPGLLSAEGILDAPRVASATRTVFLTGGDAAALAAARDAARAEAEAALRAEHVVPAVAEAVADCRYAGQTFTLPVPVDDPGRIRAAFEALHTQRYGYALPEAALEVVAVRVQVRTAPPAESAGPAAPTGEAFAGPCAVSAYSATLWLPAGWRASRLASGDLVCSRIATPAADSPAALPLALEVHRQRLAAIAEEMGAHLMTAAFSANIKERRDFSCALFDAGGRMLVHAAHIPVHLGSTPLSVRAAIDAVPMRPGVSVVLNDPFAGGTHLPDVTLVTPVFLDGEARPAYYVANRAHHADVGGVSPGSLPSPRDADGHVRPLTVDDEGIRLPPAALDDALRARFAAASRTPEERRGDLRAQEAANHVGAQRLAALTAEIGRERARALDEALLDYAERRMRAVLAALPDGEWRFTDWLDDDGAGDTPVPIPVTVRIAGDAAEVDFTAAPDQVPGPLNAVRAIAVSAVFYVFRCLAAEGIPANEGLLRPIRVLTRPGSIVDALPPAAVSAGNVETSQRLVDALFGALAQASDRVPAASCGTMNNVLFGGEHAGRAFVHYETLGGGAGGSARGPGASAIHVHMTNTLNTPVEALERAYPVRIVRYAVRPAAAPIPGVHAGGAGIVRAYRFLAPAEVNLLTERRRLAPWGLGGAPDGERGRNRLRRADGAFVDLPGKVTLRVAPGDEVWIETPGGGSHRE